MVQDLKTIVSSKTKTVEICRSNPVVIIGERINPTGRKKMLKALQDGDFDIVRSDAVNQVEAGAKILDVNAGVPGADEPSLLKQVLTTVMEVTDVPLCIDTADPEALDLALKTYGGKALINSVNGEEKSLDAVLPLVKEYKAAVIGLTQDEQGIPTDPDKRLAIAQKIVDRAEKMGIPREEIIIDCLASAIGADQNSGLVTLETIKKVKETLGVNITLGASNVSFGMPGRDRINNAFISAAIPAGSTSLIVNSSKIRPAVLAIDFILGQDQRARRYTQDYRTRKQAKK